MKRKIKKCNDCGEQDAEFYAKYLKEYRKDFGKGDYFCAGCLINNLDGLHSGGGPTASNFGLIKRIKQPIRVKSEKFSEWQKMKKLRDIICFSSMGFGTNKTLACIYGIVVKWDKASLDELLELNVIDQSSYDGLIRDIGLDEGDE